MCEQCEMQCNGKWENNHMVEMIADKKYMYNDECMCVCVHVYEIAWRINIFFLLQKFSEYEWFAVRFFPCFYSLQWWCQRKNADFNINEEYFFLLKRERERENKKTKKWM